MGSEGSRSREPSGMESVMERERGCGRAMKGVESLNYCQVARKILSPGGSGLEAPTKQYFSAC